MKTTTNPPRSGFAMASKALCKEALWLLARHRPGPDRNICLFSSRRGGSTWLMEVIAANRGIAYSDQPFSLFSASPAVRAALPMVESSQFVHLNPEDEERVRIFLKRTFDGDLRVNAPWEFWRSSFDFVSNRLVLKILAAKGLIDWIDRNFDVDVVYSTRHPIPTALSVIRNGWSLTAEAYLKNPHFVETYLDSGIQKECWRILQKGFALQKHVLNWALENLVPFRLLPDRPRWVFVSYEDAMLDPESVINRLSERLNLRDCDRMRRHIRQPSRSTRKLDSTFSPIDEARVRLEGWREKVSESDARVALDICHALGVTLYSYNSPVVVRDPTKSQTSNTAMV